MAEIIGKSIKKLVSVDSTNNYASKQLRLDLCEEGTIIVAEQQTSGRGQQNNKWESEARKNLLLSIIFKPSFLPVHYQFLLSKVVALGIRDAITSYTEDVWIKWPNDIYIGDRKVAGVLIENSLMGSVIDSSIAGIGLNVNQMKFYSDAPNPVSIAQATNSEINLDNLFNQLIEKIDNWYKALRNGDVEAIDQAYHASLYRINKQATYSDKDGIYTGTIVGVNKIGQLMIKKQSGTIAEYNFKEVQFL